MNRRQFILSGTVAGSYLALMRADVTSLFRHKKEPLGLGIIGLGERGARRLEDARASVLTDVKAICDVDERLLRSVLSSVNSGSRSTDVLGTPDADLIFADPDVKAVAIAASSSATAELIRRASAAGKHVLVEAPWSNSVADSASITTVAARSPNIIYQCTYDPDWDDDYFDLCVAPSQKDVVFAHLSIAVGVKEERVTSPLLFEGMDLLGATTRWMGVGSEAHISSISSGGSQPFCESAAVRFSFPSNDGKDIVMSIVRTPQLSSGELQATIETRTKSGQQGIFRAQSQRFLDGETQLSKNLIHFVNLTAIVPDNKSLRVQRSHQLNSLILSAQESVEHRRAVRLG
jgi:hypothetical protein